MEPLLVEFGKYGLFGLSFGVLLYVTIRDKQKMANDMREDSKTLVELVKNNTLAMQSLRDTLASRPCLHNAKPFSDAEK